MVEVGVRVGIAAGVGPEQAAECSRRASGDRSVDGARANRRHVVIGFNGADSL
jgi:hypothetical protein